jgi:hypothetical protein
MIASSVRNWVMDPMWVRTFARSQWHSLLKIRRTRENGDRTRRVRGKVLRTEREKKTRSFPEQRKAG